MCVPLPLQVVNYEVLNLKESTAKGIHNDVRLKCVLWRFLFCYCFFDMNWLFYRWEQKEFCINSLDHSNSQAAPETAQCQYYQVRHGLLYG